MSEKRLHDAQRGLIALFLILPNLIEIIKSNPIRRYNGEQNQI